MDHVHAHLRAYLSDIAALPGGQLAESRGMLWSQTQIPWPMFNGAITTPELGPCDAAERVVAELAGAGLPWFMWVLPDTPASVVDAAAQAGAIEFDHQAPWLEARIADLEEPELPAGVTIEEVRDEAGHRLWAAALREICEFPELGEQAWTMPGELCGWRDLPWRQWIAFADGEPAAVTLLYCGGGVAGLFGVGTKQAMRRRGLGRLVTLLPLKESGEQLAGFFSTPKAHTYIAASASSRKDGSAAGWEACPTRKRSSTPAAPRALTPPNRDGLRTAPFARQATVPSWITRPDHAPVCARRPS